MFISVIGSLRTYAQLDPPSLRCASVSNVNDIILTWVIPPDPTNAFSSYEIYYSPTGIGYSLAGTVNTYTQNTFTHIGANGSAQSRYYYIITKSNGGTLSSATSNTLQSVFMNLNAPPSGINTLSWNTTGTPLLPSASTTFTVSRENPTNVWTTLYTGSGLSLKDTISVCSIFYNYKVQTSDAQGCISQSNINGGLYHDGQHPYDPILDSVSVNAAGLSTLGWQSSASSGAIKYVIYKFTAGLWNPVDTIFGGNITNYTYLNSSAASGPEEFRIAAIDSCKNITLLGQIQTTIFLTTSYDLCSRTANLTWTPYGNLLQGVLEYDVYCSVNAGSFTKIGSSNGTTYTHPNLNPGDTYCYFIRVKNGNQTITASSNQTCLLAKAPSGPAYVYINSVSVNANNQVEVRYSIDNTKVYKGAIIFKSVDNGVTYKQLSYQAYSTAPSITFVDKDVKPTEKNYYYKIQLSDSCGNPGVFSDSSKTIVLHVSNDNANIFYNTLTWDDYARWSGNVNSYNIYRAVNGVFDPTPITNVFYGIRTYVDNVEGFVSDQGKFSYYVEAVEGPGNIYGFKDSARSNIADAYVEAHIFVPNAFAPKGINNIWLPVAQYVEKTDYKVKVFDRWGATVFETTSDTEGWNGSNSTDEVYVYLIEYKNARGEYIQLKGHLNLVR
jgi:gliding motility-associated-like protein